MTAINSTSILNNITNLFNKKTPFQFSEGELYNYITSLKTSFSNGLITNKTYITMYSWYKLLQTTSTIIEALNHHRIMCENNRPKQEKEVSILNEIFKRPLNEYMESDLPSLEQEALEYFNTNLKNNANEINYENLRNGLLHLAKQGFISWTLNNNLASRTYSYDPNTPKSNQGYSRNSGLTSKMK